mgnify:CR=1 FL=1
MKIMSCKVKKGREKITNQSYLSLGQIGSVLEDTVAFSKVIITFHQFYILPYQTITRFISCSCLMQVVNVDVRDLP